MWHPVVPHPIFDSEATRLIRIIAACHPAKLYPITPLCPIQHLSSLHSFYPEISSLPVPVFPELSVPLTDIVATSVFDPATSSISLIGCSRICGVVRLIL